MNPKAPKKICPCRYKSCVRHGKCDECRQHHIKNKNGLAVACERKKQKNSKGLEK